MPLGRRTPMRQGKPLQRRTPLRGGSKRAGAAYTPPEPPRIDLDAATRALTHQAESAATERTYAGPVETSQRAPKPSNTGFPPVVRQTILDRDAYECWGCGADVTVRPGSLQHRDNRGSGGTLDPRVNWPSNGITFCGDGTTGCHGWTERNPIDAGRKGWAVESWADPETVPVLHHRLGWMLLDRRGGRWVTAEPVNGDAHTSGRRKERWK